MNIGGIDLFDCDFDKNFEKDEKCNAYGTIVHVKYQYLMLLENDSDLSEEERHWIKTITDGLDEALKKLNRLEHINEEVAKLFYILNKK